jgi:hypothetical protein
MVLKTRAEAKANFEAAVTYIPSRYTAGVKKADWAGPAGSDVAEANWAAGVSKAAADKRRQAAIRLVSNTEWQTAAAEKGGPIIGDRIRKALGKWEGKWGPMYDAVAGAVPTLPARTVNWEENIDRRLKAVVRKWKEVSGKL